MANGIAPCLIVEGNIGAGKSTFLRMLKQYLNAQLVFEPHERWQDVGGENLLEAFYKDTQRWAYSFQTYAFVTRVVEHEQHTRRNTQPLQVLERSVFSDRFCFAKNCYDMGLMSALEWKLYQEWFAWLVEGYVRKPSGFIYLRTRPEVCQERMRVRNRSEETEVSLEYLKLIHARHEDWLIHKKDLIDAVRDVPVLVLEVNEEFENVPARQREYIEKIAQFVYNQFGIPRSEAVHESALQL